MRALALPFLIATLALAVPAHAGDNAEQLFKQGIELRDKGDLAGACAKFEESFRLSNETGPLLNWANCDEKRGRLLAALEHWKKASVELPEGEGKKLAVKRVSELSPRVPHVVIKAADAPAGTHAEIDGLPVAMNTSVAVDPGDHVVVVSAPGYESERLSVSVRETENRDVPLTPTRKSAGGPALPPTATPTSSSPVPPPPESNRKTIGFVLGGVGVAGAIAFGITGGLVLQKKGVVDGCSTGATSAADCVSARSAGRTLNVVNAIAFGVGLAGLGAGIILIATAPSSSTSTTGRATPGSSLSLAVGPTGVSSELRF